MYNSGRSMSTLLHAQSSLSIACDPFDVFRASAMAFSIQRILLLLYAPRRPRIIHVELLVKIPTEIYMYACINCVHDLYSCELKILSESYGLQEGDTRSYPGPWIQTFLQ